MRDNLPYTVVGYYPETDETYVEWVAAAIKASMDMDEARMEAVTVSVFEGLMVDKWTNNGRASGEQRECISVRCSLRNSIHLLKDCASCSCGRGVSDCITEGCCDGDSD